MNRKTFLAALERGLTAGDWSLLEKWISRESSFSFNYDSHDPNDVFDEAIFERIVQALASQDLQKAQGASSLLQILEYDWSRLSTRQRNRLLLALEQSFSKFEDEMCWFLIVELLGKYYLNAEALSVLIRLKTVEAEAPRSLIPVGLSYIVNRTENKILFEKAYLELVQMRSDSSEQVRQETDIALKGIQHRANVGKD